MKIYTVILLLFVAELSWSNYIFDNSKGQVLGETPFFDCGFIKSHKIKKITGHYSTKASMDIIRETNNIYTYEFDQFGHLTSEYLTKNKDTLITLYTYDSDGRITFIMKSNMLGYISEHFIYDKRGRVIRKVTKRETSKGSNSLEFERDESYEISNEKYEYIELQSGNYKKLYYNKMDKVYKEEIIYVDETQNIIETETRMTIGAARKEVKYLYDKNGRISRIESESWIMGHHTSINKFEYDEKGRVMAKHYYKNDHYETEYQILYDSQTGFLSSILTRNASNDFITILKFTEYKFF